jgi:hypothetical protein
MQPVIESQQSMWHAQHQVPANELSGEARTFLVASIFSATLKDTLIAPQGNDERLAGEVKAWKQKYNSAFLDIHARVSMGVWLLSMFGCCVISRIAAFLYIYILWNCRSCTLPVIPLLASLGEVG